MAKDSDRELIRGLRGANAQAFHRLVEQYAQYLYGLAVRLLGSPPDAEDVVQETFAGAFRGLGRFQERSSLKTWLTRILIRQIARHRRSRGRRKAAVPEVQRSADEVQVPSGVWAAEVRMDVQAAIGSLSVPHREVILLREVQGLSYEEIAEVLGVPRGTVESRLFRARRELQGLLKEYLTHERM